MKEFLINITVNVIADDIEEAYSMVSCIRNELNDFDYVLDVLENDVEEL